MSESLLSPSRIKLFGRLFDGLSLNRPSAADVFPPEEGIGKAAESTDGCSSGENPPGEPTPDASYDLLTNQLLRADARLARIYSFSYEGQYTELPRPSVYVVHGNGRLVSQGISGELDRSGVAARDWSFEADVRYWEYDRINYALRLDIISGTLDEILIEACQNAGTASGSRSNLASRSNLSSRSNLNARSDFGTQHRVR